MPLETGTYISALDANNPDELDKKSQGDDHLRFIKAKILETFPNISGEVTPTHTELNYVDGVLANIQDQLDAKTAKNFILNGRWNIAQGDNSFVSASTGSYWGDIWQYNDTSAAVHNLGIGTPGSFPTVAAAGELLTNAGIVHTTTTDAAVAAGDYTYIEQVIEGYNFRNLAQRALKLGFWVLSTSTTGTFCVALRNGDPTTDKSCVLEYTIDAANTWEYKELTIPASPSTGTWDYTSGVGLRVAWLLMCGTSFHTTAGSWVDGNKLATSNQVNFNATDNYFYITGIKLSAEDQFSFIEAEDIEQELAKIQRYFWRGTPASDLNYSSYAVGALASWAIKFPVDMRATPTMTSSFTGITLSNSNTPSVGAPSSRGCRLLASSTAIATNCNFTFAAGNYIQANARF